MVTDCAALIMEGALYKPFDKVPNAGVMDQVTEPFVLPATAAVNCWLCEVVRVAVRGLMLTLTMGGGAATDIVPELPSAGMESPAPVDAVTAEICTGTDEDTGLEAI